MLKQSQAIIPNIIHSLDASLLIYVINTNINKDNYPVLPSSLEVQGSVHDCFETLPNYVENLLGLLKTDFILLYTKYDFINKYQDNFIQSILDNNYQIKEGKVGL